MFHPFFGCVWFICVILILGYPMWRIAEKAGFPGVMSLIMYVPLVNLIVLWYLALNEWPIELELRRWRGSVPVPAPGMPPAPPPPGAPTV
jgi:hypothetical protein